MSRFELAPSILSCDPSQFRPSVDAMMRGGADWIHFDVMDGQFVPPITFGHELVASLRSLGDTPLEAHLMTLTPERHIDAFIAAGCRRITFHVEAAPHAHRLVQELRGRGVAAGVALNPGTPSVMAEPLLDEVDLVLVMTVNPGWGGQRFIDSTLRKIERLRSLSDRVVIQVDGGIDPANLRRARDAGANSFVAGSFLTRAGTIEEALGALREACG